MMVQTNIFRGRVSRCLIIFVAISLCPLLSVNGFAQDQPNSINKLIKELKSPDPHVRHVAASALSQIGAAAVPALIEALKDNDPDVRRFVAEALALISKGLFDARSTEMLPVLKEAYESMKGQPDQEMKQQAADVKRTIDYFESLWWVGLREKISLWISNHSTISGIIGAYLFLLIFWALMFWLRPLWLLSVSAFLGRYEPKIKTQNMEVGLPLRHLSLVSLFHYRKRVLDRWVRKHLATARENFANGQTVKERRTYVQTPAMINEQTGNNLSPALMQPIFDKPKSTVLICGEGGAGKTSLACQMAVWAMADEPQKRLCKSHRLLPVLIEGNLEPPANGKDAFIESIRGHLRELIGMPDEIPEELLLQLLRKRRVLVMVDSLSELDEATRGSIKPAQPDFPVAALLVTSRLDDDLSGAAKTIIKPLRLNKVRLSSFMDRYLEQRGKQFETDEELFESCRNLSRLIGERDITALIAKMYAELMIASKEQPSDSDMPANLPDLMMGYVCNINESVQADRQATRAVLRVAKAAAWECLRKTCRPAAAKRDAVLMSLKKETDAKALLEYVEKRLQLIQTAGADKDAIRFSLDPLAEYLASMYVIEHYNDSLTRWQELFTLIKAQPGAPELIKGFLLALLDCCRHHGREHGVPESIIVEINAFISRAPALAAAAN
jgi:HEAT repeat protein